MSDRIVVEVDQELVELVPGFLEARLRDVALIRRWLEEGRLDAVAAAGHRMAGSGGGYGFAYITEIGRRLEGAGGGADGAEALAAAYDLEDYLSRLEVVYVELSDPADT